MMKSAKQLSEAIQHLCFFDADPALLQTMVNLILHNNIQSSDKDGRLVLRLAHYFASSLPPQTKLANMQMKGLLAKQVVHKQLNRRLIALRTLSVAASDSDVRTDLQKHIQSVLNSVESQAAAGAQSRNDAVTNACLQYACMAAIRQRPSQLLLGAGSTTPHWQTPCSGLVVNCVRWCCVMLPVLVRHKPSRSWISTFQLPHPWAGLEA